MTLVDRNIMQLEGSMGSMTFDVRPDSDLIKVKMGKEERIINRIDLWSMVFAISGPDHQEKMMPVRKTEVMHFDRRVKIMLKKDMKKGQVVSAILPVSVPVSVVEGLRGMIDSKASLPSGVPIIGA